MQFNSNSCVSPSHLVLSNQNLDNFLFITKKGESGNLYEGKKERKRQLI